MTNPDRQPGPLSLFERLVTVARSGVPETAPRKEQALTEAYRLLRLAAERGSELALTKAKREDQTTKTRKKKPTYSG